MLHAYLLVDGARTAQFYPRQKSEFCQLKRCFYQSVKSIRCKKNPESCCPVATFGIVNAYGGTGKNHQLLIFIFLSVLLDVITIKTVLLLFIPEIRLLRVGSHIKRMLSL